jgi:hypothetical protein
MASYPNTVIIKASSSGAWYTSRHYVFFLLLTFGLHLGASIIPP